jgi:hypothetical protein
LPQLPGSIALKDPEHFRVSRRDGSGFGRTIRSYVKADNESIHKSGVNDLVLN